MHVIAAAILILLNLAPGAQRGAPPADPAKRSEGHKRLDAVEGNWDVTVKFRYGTSAEMTGKARMQAAWTLDGKLLRQDYVAESGQVTLQYYGFDVQRGTYFLIKFDNFDTGVVHAEGGVSADGKVITTIGDRVDPMSGKVGPIRIALTIADTDHFNV